MITPSFVASLSQVRQERLIEQSKVQEIRLLSRDKSMLLTVSSLRCYAQALGVVEVGSLLAKDIL